MARVRDSTAVAMYCLALRVVTVLLCTAESIPRRRFGCQGQARSSGACGVITSMLPLLIGLLNEHQSDWRDDFANELIHVLDQQETHYG
jgi:hypothetical protein